MMFETAMGTMTVTEILLYFDGPHILSCQDEAGRRYVAHMVQEFADCDRWFLVPVSLERSVAIRKGEIDLRTSVRHPEPGWIWDITVLHDGSQGNASKRDAGSLDEFELPGPNARLHLKGDPPTLYNETNVKNLPHNRDTLLISLDDGRHSKTISASNLGAVLLGIQRLVEVVGLTRSSYPTRGLREDLQLSFVDSFAASVGIRLESRENDLAGSLTSHSLDELMQLLKTEDNKILLSSILPNMHPWAVARYRSFLGILDRADLSFHAKWFTGNRMFHSAILTLEKIRSIISILGDEEESMERTLSLHGDIELLGVISDDKGGIRKASFEFISSDDGEHYRGTLSESLKNKYASGDSLEIPARGVVATIMERIDFNPATSEEKLVYTLLRVSKQ